MRRAGWNVLGLAVFVVMVLSLQSDTKSMEMAIGPWRIATTPLR